MTDNIHDEVWSRGCIGSKKLGYVKIIRGGYYVFFPEKQYLTLTELYVALQEVEYRNDEISDKRFKKLIEREEKVILICRGYGVYR